ncbi:MAG: hypothetical protein RLZZ631_1895 [Cyanobacteriota bacterium]
MKRARLFAALSPAIFLAPVFAQPAPTPELVMQQQTMQNLLNNAIVAIEANNEPQACSLRAQALTILNANLQAFQAVFPANNWSDLQTSLDGSVARCNAKGL